MKLRINEFTKKFKKQIIKKLKIIHLILYIKKCRIIALVKIYIICVFLILQT